MRDFAAIDFETANSHRSSVCSVGIVVVREGAAVDEYYELIRPAPNFYSQWATDIHGLSYGDTARAALFPEVWRRIVPYIGHLPLVAHNMVFDRGCLQSVHEHYGMKSPRYRFHCTWRMAQKAFPELENHRLGTVAAHVGLDLRDHHNALADARACARIALAIE